MHIFQAQDKLFYKTILYDEIAKDDYAYIFEHYSLIKQIFVHIALFCISMDN